MNNFIKNTLIGGIAFLIPLVIFVVVVGKGLSLVHVLATPALSVVPIESIFGAAAIHVMSVLLLVLFCFACGLFSQTRAAAALGHWLERNVLEKIPVYALLRAKLRSVLQPEELEKLQPIMVRFDDSWQFALLVESVDDTASLVYLPGAPDAWSGAVCIVEASRVATLDMNVQRVNHLMKRLGEGAAEDLSELKFEAVP